MHVNWPVDTHATPLLLTTATCVRPEPSCSPSPQALEYAGQAVLTAALLLTGKWLTALLQGAMLLYLLHSYSTRQHLVDATDVFRQLPVQKKVQQHAAPLHISMRRDGSAHAKAVTNHRYGSGAHGAQVLVLNRCLGVRDRTVPCVHLLPCTAKAPSSWVQSADMPALDS